MSAIDIETIQRAARLAARCGDAYLYARLLPVAVTNETAVAEWALGYLRALSQLGLGSLAGRVADNFGQELRALPEFGELASRLSAGEPGHVAWKSRARRFSANLRALATRDADAAEHVRHAWDAQRDTFELHQCRDGNVQIRPAGPVWPPRWLPALDDHRAAADRRIAIPRTLIPPPILFDSVGTGWEVDFAWKRTHRVFLEASSALYIVENSAAMFAVALHAHDWRKLLADPRVCVFVGEAAARQFADLLETDAAWPAPAQRFMLRCDADHADDTLQSIIDSVARSRAAEAASRRAQIATRLEDRDSAWWADRFAAATRNDGSATDQPLRILGLTSIHTTFLQYSMRDCLRALERLGHQTKLLIEPAPHQHLDPTAALRTQAEFDPDLILVLSRMRDECSAIAHPSIPAVCWDQDALPWVFNPSRSPTLAWNDFLMGFAAVTGPRRFGWPQHRCMPCPMAASADTYGAEALSDAELAPYRCDISYVSHASATPEAEVDSVAGWLPDDRLRRIFRTAVDRLLPDWLRGGEFPGPIMTAVLDAAAADGAPLRVDDAHKVGQAVGRIGDRAFRHVALDWVADWAERTGRSFALWGNGWDRHPHLARFARGPAANGHELRCIYQGTRINLQLMAYGFLHQRALDGLMTGGFFMARLSLADWQGAMLRELVALFDRFGVEDAGSLRAVTDTASRARMIEILTRCGRDPRLLTSDDMDVFRQGAESIYAIESLPRFDQITFTDAASFANSAERFLADDGIRAACAQQMHSAVVEQYSYDARMRQMLGFVKRGFQLQAAGDPATVGETTIVQPSQPSRDRVGLATPTA